MSDSKERFKKRRVKARNIINVRAWMGYDDLSSSASYLKNVASRAFVPPPESERDDFAEIVEQMGLTSEQIKKKQNSFLRLCIVAIILAILVFIYAVYHLFEGHFKAFFPTSVLSLVCLSFAFRYHFWYFQIKQRRLGCSFKEWLDYILRWRK